jgi:hypothetical protein
VATSDTRWLPAVENVTLEEPVHATDPWDTPFFFHEHDVPLLDQVAPKAVEVVPLDGLSDAAHVGGAGPSTVTVFESHDTVPPGPVAVSVT